MEVTKDTPTNDVKGMAPYVKPISAIPTVFSSETMNEERKGQAKEQFLAKKGAKTRSKENAEGQSKDGSSAQGKSYNNTVILDELAPKTG